MFMRTAECEAAGWRERAPRSRRCIIKQICHFGPAALGVRATLGWKIHRGGKIPENEVRMQKSMWENSNKERGECSGVSRGE